MPAQQIFDLRGLTSIAAKNQLISDGPNELPSQKSRHLLILLWDTIREPMILLLVTCGLLYAYLGEMTDAVLLLISVFVLIGITLFQEQRSEKVLESLKQLSSPRTVVIRDGMQVTIPGRDVVRNDIVLIREGDRIPADGVVLESVNLNIDESILTGESLPVGKTVWDGRESIGKPGGDAMPFVYSGTLVIQGHGIAKVLQTGVATEMGKIGKSIELLHDEDTLLKRETDRIVRIIGSIGLGICLLVALLSGLARSDWTGGILSGLTLGMSMIPEEFPVVLVLFLTFGAWRMSKYHVLTRNTAAIETLGAATVLCVDKTGTLTENHMSIANIIPGIHELEDQDFKNPISEESRTVLRIAALASQQTPFDPMEKEIMALARKNEVQIVTQDMSLAREYPMTKKFTAITHAWKNGNESGYYVYTKGAPESILSVSNVSDKQKKEILTLISRLAGRGMRVLAVAQSHITSDDLPQQATSLPHTYMGLLCFADPIRPTVKQAVIDAYQAGIRVIMITGDYPGTAKYVAREAGIRNTEMVITGDDLTALSDEKLTDYVNRSDIFARVLPEQKLRIVTALKANRQIVAMTGDGVNDAPALKAAHIGIAVGGRGTDVAREASDLVLLKDDFSVIVTAVRLGRKIYENIKKAMAYVVAVHIPIGGIALIPAILNLPPVLLPAHIAFLELIIDPACSIVFEAEHSERDSMRRPPRDIKERLFNRNMLGVSILQGISVLMVVLFMYFYALLTHAGETAVRTVAFTTLILSNIFLILVNLSWSRSIIEVLRGGNKALSVVAGGATILLSSILFVPALQKLFHFGSLSGWELTLSFLAAFAGLLWFEILKLFQRKHMHQIFK